MVILLGGTGYVGGAFQNLFKKDGIDYISVTRSDCDYTRGDSLRKLLDEVKPEFVINAAGYTGKPNVDACESDRMNCLYGNAILPGVIAAACSEKKIPWGHVSSGCIYTGRRSDGLGFREEDIPNFSFRQNNCSFYSGTKALGEELLSEEKNCYLWRLRLPFSEVDGPRNYLTKLMRYTTLADFENSLSQLNEYVGAAWACWSKRVPFGIYNVTNPGAVTTREVVGLIQKAGVCNKEYQYFSDEAEFMSKAATARRSNCVLDSSKLERAGIVLREAHEAVELALKNWKKA